MAWRFLALCFEVSFLALDKTIHLKHYSAIIFALLFCYTAAAQTDSLPIYKRLQDIPPFVLTKAPDSTSFSKEDLKKRKATLIMIFSPDCDHCKHATKDLLEHYRLFKDVQIVMATPLDYKFVLPFYKEYNIASYPNITMGRDKTYFLGTFFSITSFPAIFLYDKKGKFKEAFNGSVSFEKIAASL